MSEYKKILLGAMPSPADERDYPLARLVAPGAVRPKELARRYKGPVKDQGQVGGCVGYSTSESRGETESQQLGQPLVFSAGFNYGLITAGQTPGPGRYIREVLQNMRTIGAVLESDFPGCEEYPAIQKRVDAALPGLKAKAAEHKITSYAILVTMEDIRNAMYQIGPVVVCIPVYESFYQITKDNPVAPIPNTKTEKLYGYHAIMADGYRANGNIDILNSWGIGWGDNGWFQLPEGFPITEAWSITDNIQPHPEPDPTKIKYYRVQVGSYKIIDNANKTKAALEKKGFKPVLVLLDGYYSVQVGYCILKAGAVSIQKVLMDMGYSSIIKYY